MDETALGLIVKAIQNARKDYPASEAGTFEDEIYENTEDAKLFANAILDALYKGGYVIKKRSS